jgi:hypothetical protein
VQLSTVLLIKYKIKNLVQQLRSFTIIILFELYERQTRKKKIGKYFNFNATNGLPKQLLNEFINLVVIFSFTKKFKLFPDEVNRKSLLWTCLTGRGGIGIRGKFSTSRS